MHNSSNCVFLYIFVYSLQDFMCFPLISENAYVRTKNFAVIHDFRLGTLFDLYFQKSQGIIFFKLFDFIIFMMIFGLGWVYNSVGKETALACVRPCI